MPCHSQDAWQHHGCNERGARQRGRNALWRVPQIQGVRFVAGCRLFEGAFISARVSFICLRMSLMCSVAAIRLLFMVGRKLPPRGPVCECMMRLSPACRTEQTAFSVGRTISPSMVFVPELYTAYSLCVRVGFPQAHQLGVHMIPLMMESDYAAKGNPPCVKLPRCMCQHAQFLAEC